MYVTMTDVINRVKHAVSNFDGVRVTLDVFKKVVDPFETMVKMLDIPNTDTYCRFKVAHRIVTPHV